MTRAPNGPEFWDVILRDLRRYNDIEPIIAGGAVRDFVLGGEAKDIDVWFFRLKHEGPRPHMQEARGWMRTMPEDVDEYEGNHRLKMLHNYVFQGWNVQLIGVAVAPWGWEGLVNDFNIGLSKMAYDGAVHIHADALTDIANKTVTIVRPNAGERAKRCVEKAVKLADKYGYFADNSIPTALGLVDEYELEALPF